MTLVYYRWKGIQHEWKVKFFCAISIEMLGVGHKCFLQNQMKSEVNSHSKASTFNLETQI